MKNVLAWLNSSAIFVDVWIDYFDDNRVAYFLVIVGNEFVKVFWLESVNYVLKIGQSILKVEALLVCLKGID